MEFTSQRVDKTTTKFAPKLKPKAPVKKPAASPRLTPATPGNAGTPLVESLPPASQESVLPTLSTQPDLPPTPLTLPSITITAPPHGAASDVQKSPRKTSPLRNRAPSPPKLVIPPPASPTRISDGFAASQESMILVSPRPSDDRSSKASQTQPGRTGTAHESETKLPTSPSQSQAKKNVRFQLDSEDSTKDQSQRDTGYTTSEDESRSGSSSMAKSALKRKPTSPESKASSPIQKRYRALVTDNRFLDDEDDFSHYEYTPAAKPAPMPPTLKSTKGIAITVPGQAVSRKPEASPTLKPVSPRLKPSFSPRIKPMGSPRLASALEPLPPMVLADAADSEPSVIEVDNEELPISGFSLRQLIDSPFRRGKMSQKMMEYLESKKSMRRQSPALRSRSGTPVSERAASPMSIKSDGPEPAEDSDDSKQDIKPSVSSFGPQIRIVNGQIVVDEQSLMIADDAQSEIGEMEEVDESDRHITSASFSRKPRIVGKWTKEETRLFYDALSMFGTDFNLISKMFPGKNRTLLKRKYRLEERLHGSLVTKALRHRKTPDQDVLETMELRANQERSLREAEQQALGTLPDPQGQSLAAGERPAEEGPPASDSEERTELKNEIIQSTRDHASLRQVPVVGARSGPPVVASSRAAEPARTEPARAEPGTSRTETSAGPDADTAAAADGSQAESKTNQGGPDATEAEAATTKPTSSPAQAMLPVLSEKVMALISSPVSRMVGKGSRTGFAPKIVKKKAKGVPMKQDPAPTD